MALITCTECSSQVSDQAKSCPQCGAKNFKPKPLKKPTSKLTWALVMAVIFGAVMASQQQKNSAAVQEKTPEQIAADEKRNDRLTIGIMAANTLKKGMKDPESFSLTYATVKPTGAACYEYRAKNSFGAIFPGSAVLTRKKKLLVHESDGNAFVSAWNNECTQGGGEDILEMIKNIGSQ